MDPLKQLAIVDPQLAEKVEAALMQSPPDQIAGLASTLVRETLWGMALEVSFGQAIAEGYMALIVAEKKHHLPVYRRHVRAAGQEGPSLGWIMATFLAPVLKLSDKPLFDRFLSVVGIMHSKGAYTLKRPLTSMTSLLSAKEIKTARAYLDLLDATFSRDMSYNRCLHFSHRLPKMVLAWHPLRREYQIRQLTRVIRFDLDLAESFFQGMEGGLALLSAKALDDFVLDAFKRFRINPKMGSKFLALKSSLGFDTFSNLLVIAPLHKVIYPLNRYIRARTGLALTVRPLSAAPCQNIGPSTSSLAVCSDGKCIYLSDEIDIFPTQKENERLYKYLAGLEAAYYECHTFDFDLDKLAKNIDLLPPGFSWPAFGSNTDSEARNQPMRSDLESLFACFAEKELAQNLFTAFEHGRIRILLTRWYPGFIRQVLPVLQNEFTRLTKAKRPMDALNLLYAAIALDMGFDTVYPVDGTTVSGVQSMAKQFLQALTADDSVQSCATLTMIFYDAMDRLLKQSSGFSAEQGYLTMAIPFGRRLRPDLYYYAFQAWERIAQTIKVRLVEAGYDVTTSDIRKRLWDGQGKLSQDDIKEIVVRKSKPGDGNESKDIFPAPSQSDLARLLASALDQAGALKDDDHIFLADGKDWGPTYRYREWDRDLNDYIENHVRVVEKEISPADSDFYHRTQTRYAGLLKRMRYAFELLKPEGLVLLRQWLEGDEFDYRALLDFAVDIRAGRTPSERLYMKRLKQQRDVAVLLLVDLSRSTANYVDGLEKTVLDVEKEAIVLFCEALEVVGDAFAIAGFSGSGRLGVDYFKVKDFNEPINEVIKGRIGAMASQRGTRMGAAIRHATAQLAALASKVRLIVTISDGFPNDIGYKQAYALDDTRKAISEARAKHIFIHGVTVNLAGEPKLDDLYGGGRHNVISHVEELPDRLLRIYNTLTR
jgi:nitric oxide reductase NorD protein